MTSTKYMSRREAAAALTEGGFPTAVATLEKLATIGGGPAYRKFGRRVIYDRSDLMAWGGGPGANDHEHLRAGGVWRRDGRDRDSAGLSATGAASPDHRGRE